MAKPLSLEVRVARCAKHRAGSLEGWTATDTAGPFVLRGPL